MTEETHSPSTSGSGSASAGLVRPGRWSLASCHCAAFCGWLSARKGSEMSGCPAPYLPDLLRQSTYRDHRGLLSGTKISLKTSTPDPELHGGWPPRA